jgi:hypothetical protein
MAVFVTGCGSGSAKRSACVSEGLVNSEGSTVQVGGYVGTWADQPEALLRPREPSVFPWGGASASNKAVLKPVRVCGGGYRSLPVMWFAFKAVATGRVTITVPVVPAWRSFRVRFESHGRLRTLQPLSRTVTVEG